MAYVVPPARTTGDLITAAIWNQDVKDNSRFLKGLDGDVFIEDSVGVGTSTPETIAGLATSARTIHSHTPSGGAIIAASGSAFGAAWLADTGAAANQKIWRLLSDGGVFSIAKLSDAGVGTEVLRMTNAGEMTLPLQPAFLAYNSADEGTTVALGQYHTVNFETEIYDRSSNYAAGTFTAPVTGIYILQFLLLVASQSTWLSRLITSNRSYRVAGFDFDGTNRQYGGAIDADMDANDTAHVGTWSDGAGTNTVRGSASPHVTIFSGRLAA